jgi:hypothetical protein
MPRRISSFEECRQAFARETDSNALVTAATTCGFHALHARTVNGNPRHAASVDLANRNIRFNIRGEF